MLTYADVCCAVKFTHAGEQHVMNLRLPVVPAKFALPVTITASDFDSAWGGCVFGGTVRSYIEALLLRLIIEAFLLRLYYEGSIIKGPLFRPF
jgi:hypothetical protein